MTAGGVEILDAHGGRVVVSDAAFEVILDARGGAPIIDADHLTPTERWQVIRVLGWDRDPRFSRLYLTAWAAGSDTAGTGTDYTAGTDYEGAILARQEVDDLG